MSSSGEPEATIFCLRPDLDGDGEESLMADNMAWDDYINFVDTSLGVPLVVYDSNLLDTDPAASLSFNEYQFSCEDKLEAVVAVVLIDNF